jgi:hypothetical protein
MDFRKLIADIVTGNTEDIGKRFALLGRKCGRFGYGLTHKKLDDAQLKMIPVIINNRNRYTYLTKLISWLESAGFENIIVLDNDSTYPPLLKYYETTRHTVIRTGRNGGPFAIWQTPELKKYISGFYIYTDPDVLPDTTASFESIRIMYQRLRSDYTIDKIGFALRIDNLPDHFKLKDEVIRWESQFWLHKDKTGFWRSKVDTTFALYAPYAKGGGECRALRTDFPHVALHLPWYENSSAPGEEEIYYREHAEPANSHWTKLTGR